MHSGSTIADGPRLFAMSCRCFVVSSTSCSHGQHCTLFAKLFLLYSTALMLIQEIVDQLFPTLVHCYYHNHNHYRTYFKKDTFSQCSFPLRVPLARRLRALHIVAGRFALHAVVVNALMLAVMIQPCGGEWSRWWH